MDVDNVISPIDRHSRATSALSMDDIVAAQALEGLRAGTVTLNPSSEIFD